MRPWLYLGAALGMAFGVWLGLQGADAGPLAAATAGFVLACLGAPFGLVLGLVVGALRREPHFVAYFALGASGIAAFMFLLEFANVRFQYELRAEGVRTRGTVVRALPKEHDSVVYRYSTPGGERTGSSSAPLTAPASTLAPGDSLDVIYLRSRPERSTAREPTDTWASTLGVALVFGVFGAGWFVFVAEIRRRRWNPRERLGWD